MLAVGSTLAFVGRQSLRETAAKSTREPSGKICPERILFSLRADVRYSLAIPSLSPLLESRPIMLIFEHEQRIRALIKAIAEERDPEKLKVLAAELEQLLKLESKPWPINDRQKSA